MPLWVTDHTQRRLLRAVAGVLAIPVLSLFMLVALQRRFLFPAPTPREISPHAGTMVPGRSPSGRRVVALWSPATTEGPASRWTVVYLHGNGMQLADCADLAPVFHARGWNVYSIEYPGYGPLSADSPSEEAIVDTAVAAMAILRTRYGVPVERTALVGQSLGTGVASALGARALGSRMALISPFRSIAEVAAGLFPWLPVRSLVRDRFDTSSLAPSVHIPVLIVHGTQDEVIPFAHGEYLSRRFSNATLHRIEGGHHNDLWSEHLRETSQALRDFLPNP